MKRNEKLTPVRCGILLVLFAVVVPAIMAAMMSAGLSFATAGVIAVIASFMAGLRLAPHLPVDLAGSGVGRRALFLFWLALGLTGAYHIANLSVFMFDVERSEYSFSPTIRKLDDPELAKPFFLKHNCFTSYIVGAHLASERVDNLYDVKYYRRAEVETPIHRQVGESLNVDTYQYPPAFLILPRLLLATGGGFYQLRAYWFALNIVALVAVVVSLVIWIGGPKFNAYWLALPVLLVSPAMLGTLQIQNAHLLIIGISLLALPAFDKRWHWLGGALLGFAIVSKLFPGLLLVFLLLQKRWWAVFWTGGWMAAYCVIALLVFGPQPFQAFVGFQMPRLATGEAFSFATTYVTALVKNGSILGIAYKLEKLGLLERPADVARVLVWVYSAVLGIVLLATGLRRSVWTVDRGAHESPAGGRLALARIWLALLILAQLRSPFLPWGYGNVPVLLLLTLLISTKWNAAERIWKTMLLIMAWAMLAVVIPLPLGPPAATPDLILTLGALAVTLFCCAIAVTRRPLMPA